MLEFESIIRNNLSPLTDPISKIKKGKRLAKIKIIDNDEKTKYTGIRNLKIIIRRNLCHFIIVKKR